MISEILGLFVNTLTAHDKYSLQNKENLPRQSQMQLSKKQKTFSEFFAPFLRSISNFQHFNKTMDFIVHVIQKIQTVKSVVWQMSKNSLFRTLFDSQHAKVSQTLLISGWQYFYYLFPWLWGKFSWKMYLFLINEVLGPFF